MWPASIPCAKELLRPPAEGWRPEPGDVLIGEVVAIDERTGFAERPYMVVTVRSEETGEHIAFHAFHTVASNELAKQRPKVGDRLGVAYRGRVTKGETTYESYRIRVVPAEGTLAEPNWDAIRAATDDERAQLDELPEPEQASDDESLPF